MGQRSRKEAEKLAIKAFQLLDNGFNQTEIADMLGVTTRTIQRWVAARPSLECNQNVEFNTNFEVVKEVEQNDDSLKPVSLEERLSKKDYIQAVLDVNRQAEKWGELVTLNLQNDYISHSVIAENMYLKLIEELQKPDPSYRTVNFLSLSYTRHCDYKYKNLLMGNETSMNVDRAIAILGRYGYSVVSMSAINQLEGE